MWRLLGIIVLFYLFRLQEKLQLFNRGYIEVVAEISRSSSNGLNGDISSGMLFIYLIYKPIMTLVVSSCPQKLFGANLFFPNIGKLIQSIIYFNNFK